MIENMLVTLHELLAPIYNGEFAAQGVDTAACLVLVRLGYMTVNV
jgi:hypothetical protein